jgi:microcystin-dependent protein
MEGYIGEIRIFAGNFAPRGWRLCDGASLPISQYDAVYALLGTTYGGDGQVTFNVPDLRGRRAVHPGQGPGLPQYYLGQAGGTEDVTLTTAQMPAHTHTMSANVNLTTTWQCVDGPAVAGAGPSGNFYARAGENAYATTVDGTMGAPFAVTSFANMHLSAQGGSQPISILTPYMAINYIIFLEGIFTSRN